MSGETWGRLLDRLATLPGHTDPDFPPELGRVVTSTPTARQDLEAILAQSDCPPDLRFAAFYGLLIHVRRFKDWEQYTRCFESYSGEFVDRFPMLNLLRSQYYLNPTRRRSLALALRYAEDTYTKLPAHYGVMAHLATVIVQTERTKTVPDVQALMRARDLEERAIGLQPTYARFFATKAEILCLLGDFDGAQQAIDQAMDLEPSDSLNYAVRISDYQLIKMDIAVRQQTGQLQATQLAAQRFIEGARAEFLTLLGLLAAVIAFIVTTSQVVSQVEASDAMLLMLTMSGCIVIVFAVFGLIFVQRQRALCVAAGIFGLILVLVAKLTI